MHRVQQPLTQNAMRESGGKRVMNDNQTTDFRPVAPPCFPPCTLVNSLLITSLRAAKCTARRDPVDLRPLFRASPCLDNAHKTGAILSGKARSISWGVRATPPNRNDTFRPDGPAIWQPDDEFAPAFFEGKRRCKTRNQKPQSERTLIAPNK